MFDREGGGRIAWCEWDGRVVFGFGATAGGTESRSGGGGFGRRGYVSFFKAGAWLFPFFKAEINGLGIIVPLCTERGSVVVANIFSSVLVRSCAEGILKFVLDSILRGQHSFRVNTCAAGRVNIELSNEEMSPKRRGTIT